MADEEQCRICLDVETRDKPFIAPCGCRGSVYFVHATCLKKWTQSTGRSSCDLCLQEYSRQERRKPWRKWPGLFWKQMVTGVDCGGLDWCDRLVSAVVVGLCSVWIGSVLFVHIQPYAVVTLRFFMVFPVFAFIAVFVLAFFIWLQASCRGFMGTTYELEFTSREERKRK